MEEEEGAVEKVQLKKICIHLSLLLYLFLQANQRATAKVARQTRKAKRARHYHRSFDLKQKVPERKLQLKTFRDCRNFCHS